MDSAQQMPELVSSHDNPGETPGVLHDGHAVHLLQPLVDDARPSDVGKPGGASVTVSIASLPSEIKRIPIIFSTNFSSLILKESLTGENNEYFQHSHLN